MRADWKIIIIIVIFLIAFCAKPLSPRSKWQESLDLPYPNAILFKINMDKKVFYENEPLILKILLINKKDRPLTLTHLGNTRSMIEAGWQQFTVVTELDSVLMYRLNVCANAASGPWSSVIVEPKDTLYSYAILFPDLFRQHHVWLQKTMPIGNYIIESNILLGTIFYPLTARRDLRITSYPTMFSIIPLPIDEKNSWESVFPYAYNFFAYAEEFLHAGPNDLQSYVDSAFYYLDKTRNSQSYFAEYADYIYSSLPMVSFLEDGTRKTKRPISEARKLINKYDGSILAEEMEFKLAWWLYCEDSTSVDFYNQAKRVVEKFPKNIGTFGIRRHILNDK